MILTQYIIPFFAAFVLSIIFSFVLKKIALKCKIVDIPDLARKIHKTPIPLMGGWSIFLSFLFVVIYYVFFSSSLIFGSGYINKSQIIGIIISGFLILIGGTLDDKYRLKWKKQILWPILAILIVMVFGVSISTITNPLGGYINLDIISFQVFSFKGIIFSFALLADILTFFWLMSMMYATKLLDGLDGLVSGITTIACFFIFLVSLRADLLQFDTALLAIVLAGAVLGFLLFNWHPAKMFLGEGGSILTGFLLGILSIIAGGKITTALLVMGIPLLDVAWVFLRRWIVEKKSPFKTSDKKHLHFRLIDIGLSHRRAVFLYYFFAIFFGSLIFFVQGKQKIIALFFLFLFMIILAMFLVFKYNKDE